MQPSLYVSLSGQLALMRRLDSIANNVANSSTAGYRAEEIKFEQVLSQKTREPTAFASTGETYLSRSAGELVRTDDPFDVAVNGDAWFAINTPAGTVYTRDGRMHMTPEGELQTVDGYKILDVGGAPIQLDPSGGPPNVARDGTITQGKNQVGALGLFTIPDKARLTRFENSGVIPDQAAAPALDFSSVSVAQGYIERANVNPVMEISKLILVQRNFDSITGAIGQSESSLSDAIKTLGEPG